MEWQSAVKMSLLMDFLSEPPEPFHISISNHCLLYKANKVAGWWLCRRRRDKFNRSGFKLFFFRRKHKMFADVEASGFTTPQSLFIWCDYHHCHALCSCLCSTPFKLLKLKGGMVIVLAVANKYANYVNHLGWYLSNF